MKLEFKFDLQKEAENWVGFIIDHEPCYGMNKNAYNLCLCAIPEELKNRVSKLSKEKAVKEVLMFLKNDPRRQLKQRFIDVQIKALQRIWKEKGNDLVKNLEKTYMRNLPEKVISYITYLLICDYNFKEKYFHLSLYHPISKNFTLIAHELAHFIFYQHYENYCKSKGLNENQFQDLKESMTVLLNLEDFDQLLLVDDGGYPNHQKLRKFIFETYLQNRDFVETLDKAILKINKT